MDHLTRFAVLVALPDKKEQTIARALVERVFGIFGPPETLHSDQGPEFEDKVVKQLQDVFGYKKTKTTLYRPQGNSVSGRMYSTLHAMLSMYSNIVQNKWAEVLPLIQLAHNTSFSSTMHETPFFFMFGRQARLPIDIIFGIPHVRRSTITEEFAHFRRDNLQIAFELARRNLSEPINKQKANNSKLPPIPEFISGQKVPVYKPHHSTDGRNPKLIQPWRGPYIICSKLSPVVYRIRHPDDTKQVSVHLTHMKSYRPHHSAPAPNFYKTRIVIPRKDVADSCFGRIKNGPAIYRASIKLLMLSDTGVDKGDIVSMIISIVYDSKALAQKLTSKPELTRSHNVKNLLQHTALNINLRQSRLFLAISRSTLLRTTAILSVARSHRKTVVPSKANPLFASALAISGSTLLRKTVTSSVAIPHRKTVVRSNANPLFASANLHLARIKRNIIQRGESE